jgi:hypothetical protein
MSYQSSKAIPLANNSCRLREILSGMAGYDQSIKMASAIWAAFTFSLLHKTGQRSQAAITVLGIALQ